MAGLLELLDDPNYANANAATKQAIFDRRIANSPDYTGADAATKNAIQQRFGLSAAAPASEPAPEDKPQAGIVSSFMEQAGLLGLTDEAARFAANQSDANRQAFLKAGESKYESSGGFTGIDDFDLSQNLRALKEMAGGTAGFLAAPIAAAGVGSLAGGVGGPIAGYGTMAAQYGVTNLQRQAQEQQAAIDAGEAPQDLSLGRAATAAAGQTGLDMAGGRFWGPLLRKIPFVEKLALGQVTKIGDKLFSPGALLSQSLKDGTLRPIGGRMWRGAVGGATFEVPQEIAQQALERWQAGLPVDPFEAPEAWEEYRQAFIGATALGGPMGAAQGMVNTTRPATSPPGQEEGQGPPAQRPAQIKVQVDNIARALNAERDEGPEYSRPHIDAVIAKVTELGGNLDAATMAAMFEAPDLYIPKIVPDAELDNATGADAGTVGTGVDAAGEPPAAATPGAAQLNPDAVDGPGGAAAEAGRREGTQPGALTARYERAVELAVADIRARYPAFDVTPQARGNAIARLAQKEEAGGTLSLQTAIDALNEEVPQQAAFTIGEGAPVQPTVSAEPKLPEFFSYYNGMLDEALAAIPGTAEDISIADRVQMVERLQQEDTQRATAGAPQITVQEIIEKTTEAVPEEATSFKAGPAKIAQEAETAAVKNVGSPKVAPGEINEMRGAGPSLFDAVGKEKTAADARARDAGLLEDQINNEDVEVYKAALQQSQTYPPNVRKAYLRGVRTRLGMEPGLSKEELNGFVGLDPEFFTRPATVEEGVVVKGKAMPSTVAPAMAEKQGRDFVSTQIDKLTKKAAPKEETAQEWLERESLSQQEVRDLRTSVGAALERVYPGRIPGQKNMLPRHVFRLMKEARANPNILTDTAAIKEIVNDEKRQGDKLRVEEDPRIAKVLKGNPDVAKERSARSANSPVRQYSQKAKDAYAAYTDIDALLGKGRKAGATNAATTEQEGITKVGAADRAKARAAEARALAEKKAAKGQPSTEANEYAALLEQAPARGTPSGPQVATGNGAAAFLLRGQQQTSTPVKFDADGLNISDKIPAKVAGVIRGWKKMLLPGVKLRVEYTTLANDGGAENLGSATYLGDGVYKITFASGLKPTAQLEAIAHEIGHVHEMASFRSAPATTQAALHADHAKWLEQQSGKSPQEYVEALRGRATAGLSGNADISDVYWTSFKEWYADQTARWAVSSAKPVSIVEKFFSRLGKAMHNFYKTLRGQKYLPTETFAKYMEKVSGSLVATDLFSVQGETHAMAGASKADKRAAARVTQKYLRSNTATGMDESAKNRRNLHLDLQGKLKATGKTIKATTAKLLMPVMTTEDILRWIGDRLGNPRIIQDMVNKMAGERMAAKAVLDEKIRRIQEFFRKQPKQGELLTEVAYLSTLSQIDANDTATANNKAAAKDIAEVWDKLNKDGRELYGMMLKDYKKDFEELNTIAKAQIKNSELSPAIKKQMSQKLLEMIAEAEERKVYFPLMRFGEYWFSVGKRGSDKYEFSTFKTMQARNEALISRENELRAEGKSQQEIADLIDGADNLSNFQDQVKNDPDSLVMEIINAVRANTVSPVLEDHIMDLYMRTLPAHDIRNRYNKRKDIAGFSTDLLQTYASARHSNINLEIRLKYSQELRLLASGMRDEMEGMPLGEKETLAILTDEIKARVDRELTPDKNMNSLSNKAAGWTNQAVFFYMLTSPRAAAVQMTQVPVVAAPYFVARYGLSMTKALGLLGGNMNLVYDDSKIDALFAGEKDAAVRDTMREVYKAIQKTQEFNATFHGDVQHNASASVENYSNTPGATVGRGARWAMDKMGWMFQTMESGSRKMVFATALELETKKAKAAGKDIGSVSVRAEILENSRQAVRNTLFNYTNFNKPSIMSWNPLTRVATQFMTFPLQMTSYLIRNFATSLNTMADAKDRKEAAIKFYGTTLMATMFSGAQGFVMYSAITGLLDAFSDEQDDDDDDPRNPLVMRDSDLWFREYFLPTYFGADSTFAKKLGLSAGVANTIAASISQGPVSAITGWNVGPSVSLDLGNMWLHNRGNTTASTQEAFQSWAYTFLSGPAGGMAAQIASGIDEYQNGHTGRAIEKLTPAFLRGPIKAARLVGEGERTREGAPIRDENWYTTGRLLGHTMGFSNVEVTNIQNTTFALRSIAAEIGKDRDNIYQQLDQAFRSGSDTKIDAALDKVFEFNRKNWFAPITPARLLSSLSGREQSRGEAIVGLTIEDALKPFAYDVLSDQEQ